MSKSITVCIISFARHQVKQINLLLLVQSKVKYSKVIFISDRYNHTISIDNYKDNNTNTLNDGRAEQLLLLFSLRGPGHSIYELNDTY